jgi:hypothetical protein
MYQRYKGADELLSQVLIFFGVTLTFGFLIFWKVTDGIISDAEVIVYYSLGGLSAILLIASLVVYFIGISNPFIDVKIDFEKRNITVFYGWITYSFDDIKLFSYNKRHRQVRLYIKNTVIGFFLDDMIGNGGPITLEKAMTLSENTVTVAPKIMYNYHFITASVLFGIFVFYVIAYGRFQTPFGGWIYIPTYYVLAGVVLLMALSFWGHAFRLSKHLETPEQEA